MCCHLSIVSAIALCVKGALPVAPRSDQRHIWFWVTKWCTTRIRTPASRNKPFRAPPLKVKERAWKALCNAVAVNAFGERALVWGERGCLRYARVGRVYLQMHHFVKTAKIGVYPQHGASKDASYALRAERITGSIVEMFN